MYAVVKYSKCIGVWKSIDRCISGVYQNETIHFIDIVNEWKREWKKMHRDEEKIDSYLKSASIPNQKYIDHNRSRHSPREEERKNLIKAYRTFRAKGYSSILVKYITQAVEIRNCFRLFCCSVVVVFFCFIDTIKSIQQLTPMIYYQ